MKDKKKLEHMNVKRALFLIEMQQLQVTKLWTIQWKDTIYKEERKIKEPGFLMRSSWLWKYFSYESKKIRQGAVEHYSCLSVIRQPLLT